MVETKKDPWLGVIFSYILPGLGYIYAGAKAKGLVIMSVWLSLILLSAYGVFSEGPASVYVMYMAIPALVLFCYYQLKTVHSYIRKKNPRDYAIKKDEFLAACLSLFIPGLGQLYLKKVIEGVSCILLAFVIVALKIDAYLEKLLFLLLYIFSILHAYKAARELNGKTSWTLKVNKNLFVLVIALFLLSEILPWRTIIKKHLIQTFTLSAGSMESTLLVGDQLFVSKYAYKISKVERFDIIVFKAPIEKKPVYIKRCVGLPGDKVEIRKKRLFINGIEQTEPYAKHIDTNVIKERDDYFLLVIPQGKYFVLGDNRDSSYDSRHFGLIDKKDIVGKPIKIWLPLNRIGPVK
ncbi:MAG: signal peptidase I [Candidatus Firestonebacteria bacterium RIFOXYC2_FULL_39_67]|nr:MAG: signal peptidase I [Candidatus Firestonebacteria bacterium RIFOXYD2_FULL_39_29]OGF51930.1 MAG: signal peptidase I [Candidatus Firestonebacteria bacterium RifOxyC12_full_39_7]OGF57098.1 MAG: signal peptidase I [Candidatus Firestonebacteria bacterium RIFOXYC2_FULL_39_67]